MTRDELITLSDHELGRIPPDELAVIEAHFDTTDRAELARLLAEEADEMWRDMEEAPVPTNEWPSAHLQLLLGMHRDQKREALQAERKRFVLEIIDGLDSGRRALLCWRFHTTVRARVAALAVSATVRAMEEDLVKIPTFREAAAAVIDFEIGLQVDEIDEHYFQGIDPRDRGPKLSRGKERHG
jgi:hypothetical protein